MTNVLNKSIKRILIALACALAIAVAVPAIAPQGSGFVVTAQAATQKVKLNKTKLSLVAGKKATIRVIGSSQKVTWKSNNKNVATVTQKGVVTAKKVGQTTITAKVGKRTLKCTVTVKKQKKYSGKISKNGITFQVKAQKAGNQLTLNYSNKSNSTFKSGFEIPKIIAVCRCL